MRQMPEILAPAGDFERLEMAVRFGADAVYLGSDRFGMRSSAAKFGGEQLSRAVDFAHSHGVKAYLTCNTIPRNDDLKDLSEFLHNAKDCGVDALIVADIGILMEARREIPTMEIHISTQAGITNYLTATEFYRLGAKRVVLARELNFEEIIGIRRNTPSELEIETFVHGAMCMSFSGRCVLSQYLTGRDANRGECAQPCRWGYYLMEEKREGQYFKIFEDEKGTYILNAKDLCMIEHIDDLVNAGITSFKIEGRAKSAYYVGVVTNAYRTALNLYQESPEAFQTPAWLVDEVQKVSHRKYCTGFYYGAPENGQYYETGGYIRTCDIVGVVEKCREGRLYGTQRNKFSAGDVLEVLSPGQKPVEITVADLQNENGEAVDSANHAMMPFSFSCKSSFERGSILRRCL